MFQTEDERRIVFFLGAGFAKAAGLPVMKEFGRETQTEIELMVGRHGTLDRTVKDFRYAAPRLIEAARTFGLFRNHCRDTNTKADLDWDNIEVVYGVAEALAESGADYLELDNQAYHIDSIIRDIQLWIWKVYQRMPVVQKNPPVPVDPAAYDRFFALVKQHQLASKLTEVTTNYDLVYEYLPYKNGLVCSYPFEWPSGFSVNRTPTEYVFAELNQPDLTSVCKLHGSVNYFEDAEALDGRGVGTQRPSMADPGVLVAADLGGGTAVGRSGKVRGRPALLGLDSIWVLQKRYGAGITPAIIPPTYAKLGRRRWLAKAWNSAQNALAKARTIVFVGYSLPPSDGFMTSLLAGARTVAKNMCEPRVVVVDPCDESFRRIASIYGEHTQWIEGDFASATAGELVDEMARLGNV
jgi:hypothetical protein